MKPFHPQPPHWATRLLHAFCAPHLVEELEGDLDELFRQRLESMGIRQARLRYVRDVLSLMRPFTLKRNTSAYVKSNYTAMLQHSLLLTYRNFKRFKSTFLINLIGLSTGLACALLIYLWLSDELSVDKFHANDRRLFQVMHNIPLGDGGILTSENTPGLLAKALVDEMPEVADAVVATPAMVDEDTKGILSSGKTRFKANEQYVSKNFFKVFSYPLIEGNRDLVLADNNAVVLSDELALKLFHTTKNIIGKTVEWDRGNGYGGNVSGLYLVSGVFKSPPRNSSAQFDLLFSYDLFFDKYRDNLQNWGNSNPSTYVVLREGTDIEQFNAKIRGFSRSKVKALYGPENLPWIGTLFLQRYSDRYLYNHYENGQIAGGRIEYIKLFSLVAVFLLAIACINFTNLSTARASTRLKEIGVKKAIGADRKALLFQFLGESVLMAFVSLVFALFLVQLLLPQFNDITGKQLSLRLDSQLIGAVLGITLLTGLLSGSYPALYLSGFKPVTVLKGKLHTSVGEVRARKGLVVFQFAISILLIVSVIVIYKQIEFIQSKNLGYNKDNVIHFAKEGRLAEGLGTFVAEVKRIPGVVDASSFNHDLTGKHGGTSGIGWQGQTADHKIEFGALEVDYGLLEMLGISMTQGRMFSKDFSTDSSAIIFNEAAIAAMGLKAPLGKTVTLWGKTYQIIGVTKNFNFESLYQAVKPCFMRVFRDNRNVLVKIQAGRERATIERIKQFYEAYNQGLPFEYNFLDQDYQALYAAENRVAILSRYFAGIAILISYLGLFGLAAFTAEQRTKEIGIRKVLGASVGSLVTLLSKDLLRLVLIAMLIATPVAWYAMHQWLQGFAYQIAVSWWMFGLAGLLAIGIALLTVSFQSMKAALVNPVKSLRAE